MKKIHAAQLKEKENPPAVSYDTDECIIEDLQLRIKHILGITDRIKKTPNRMLFFVMYDIENNKVRRLVSKYLQRHGCTRIQRSIFLAETSVETCNMIKNDLSAVQDAYDNHDSIIILPVSTDYLKMMKIIGQKIEVDIITHSKNTLFF
ncbi:MAG: CRISPR-associated endonuclease Cas2 [Bacteroidales bacterium]|nr:CRISPR-associated endonuclease Cas2 [Bacteroidales bacterium]MCM1147759.1 CRISPR-associated endonuclease Cas2 [Bacteroidales bacterium]MCM1206631.1 CRISPR-associated endonuclease Cas2 [Bacillota bacterium]MCM1510628.1 CRISPR-associated endonuclease Cas2 [Clostridium sp.]